MKTYPNFSHKCQHCDFSISAPNAVLLYVVEEKNRNRERIRGTAVKKKTREWAYKRFLQGFLAAGCCRSTCAALLGSARVTLLSGPFAFVGCFSASASLLLICQDIILIILGLILVLSAWIQPLQVYRTCLSTQLCQQ